MNQKRDVAQATGRPTWRRGRFTALVLALGVAGVPLAAGACDIEADGPSAYGRVKARLTDIYSKSPSVSFPAFKTIDAAVDAKCVFTLKGPFQVKKRGNLEFMDFEARLVRASGAPMGWKILDLKQGN